MNNSFVISQLLELSHQIGREDRGLAILGEGNTSTKIDAQTFAVKASGSSLGTLTAAGIAICRNDAILSLFEQPNLSDDEIDGALLASRVDPNSKKPSTEALFHAFLLTLPEIEFIGHCHPIAVNGVGCSPRGRDFAQKSLFPDQIVCCGAPMAFVPYTTPGVPLARAIREEVERYQVQFGKPPRAIILQNHGLIALGKTPNAVLATTLMAEKAAKIFIGAAACGGPTFMSDEQVAYIAGWSAEAYRQKMLNL